MTTEDTQQQPGPQPKAYPPLSALRRSRTDRHLAGVSGGLGRYAGVDPLIFRILFVVLTFFGGSGVLFYALGWLLIPVEGESESEGERLLRGRKGSSTVSTVVAGVVALILGLVLIANLFDTGPGLGGVAAVVVVAAIVVLIARSGPRPVTDQTSQQPVYGPVPPPEPGAFGQTPGTAYATSPPTGPAYVPPPPYYPPAYVPVPPVPPQPPRERSILGRVTVSSALIVVGVMVGWNVLGDDDFKAVAILASALVVVGAGLVVGAFAGRSYGLVFLGIALSIATSLTAVVDHHYSDGIGERDWLPRTVAQAETPHRLGLGEAQLDLTQLPPGSDVDVEASVGIGELRVIVPLDARVVVDGQVGLGTMHILDEPSQDGSDLDQVTTDQPTGHSSGTDITIDAEVGLGELEVRRATS
jgi:phage shock protein PspC (stress-responsive transcriptional regulator)